MSTRQSLELSRFDLRVSTSMHNSTPEETHKIDPKTFNPEIHPKLHNDLSLMIIQYLQDQGLTNSALTLQSEVKVKHQLENGKFKQLEQLNECILEGKWNEVDVILSKHEFKEQRIILYEISKQQYMELIEQGKSQKAFNFLMKRLKPLEDMCTLPNEFHELSYLLTCNSVQDSHLFKNWDGISGSSREKLLDTIKHYITYEHHELGNLSSVPPNRLVTLLEQSLCYQIQNGFYVPKTTPKIETLLHDYESFVVPNFCKRTLKGHSSNVKCIDFCAPNHGYLASGSSDNTIKIWSVQKPDPLLTLSGHNSRVWDLCSSKSGNLLASASGDGSVKIWSFFYFPSIQPKLVKTITAELPTDIYCVQYHPDEKHIVTSGYDANISLHEVESGKLIKNFEGHTSSVCSVAFNPHGNLLASGSKDCTIKFWDMRSGLCIKTFTQHLGEVTSVQFDQSGSRLLSCSKDNSNRLWDLREMKPIQRFKGHQNTYKNHIKCCFGSNEKVVMSGSEDGFVYCWDVDSGNVLTKLAGHSEVVYQTIWNSKFGVLASCGEDKQVKVWNYNQLL
jgi:COMPASS component SWD3